MKGLRNLLLVAYHFPPHGGSGVQRALKLARYLPPAGWRAHIITAGHDHYPVLDRTLCAEYADANVERVPGWEPGALAKHMAAPLPPLFKRSCCGLEDRLYWRLDRWMRRLPLAELEQLWVSAAARRARHMIREHAIEAVITTSPPCATHLVGRNLQRRMGIPWIADLRDPIVDNFSYRPKTSGEDRFFERLEATIAQEADRVVVTCPELAECLRERYRNVPAERFTTITNGYDPADAPAAVQRANSGRFTLAHVGAFYREQTVGPILDAVRQLRATRPEIRDALRLRLVGTLSASERARLLPEDHTFLDHAGYVDHRTAIEEMASADILLLTTPASDGGRLCIPAKTFEYLAFGKHMIASLHYSSWISRTIQQAGNCTVMLCAGAAEWANAIESCFVTWNAGRLQQPRDRAVVDAFRRDRIAARYARVIEEAIAEVRLSRAEVLCANEAVA
ncbi:MAG TPA: glycosyltransferase [Phycisphaerae bacterium]|nr:glycosyltransferase [Phycisphaerae bacterium]